MRIAVVGATGTIGSRIVSALQRDGLEVRALSRSAAQYPVDLRTGAGLAAGLAGCEVVIDASNGPSSGKARAVLVDGSRRLLEIEARGDVRHHVCVSILGIEDVPMGYYRVKLEQERVIKSAGVPWTIVRCTQFHDLLASMLATAGRWRVLPAAKAQFQPVDAQEAADAVAAAATGSPARERVTVAGPEVHDLRALAGMWREATGRRVITISVPLPGRAGRALRDGRLTCANADVRGTRAFAAWLRANAS